MTSDTKIIVLYDGVCALCNRLVRFLLRHDKQDQFRFAALQSSMARDLMRQRGLNAEEMQSACVLTPDGRLLMRSSVAVYVVRRLDWPWKVLVVTRLVPRLVRDFLYDVVARSRYRVFGWFDTCPLPAPQFRHKFLV
ncbi:MAG TPA: DCC1-like thiol-disulfide oxidoreductase family protein [Terriglobales bacterium]|jgi:predicted DCC family thiol-disulfide oxidoreductase YuxK